MQEIIESICNEAVECEEAFYEEKFDEVIFHARHIEVYQNQLANILPKIYSYVYILYASALMEGKDWDISLLINILNHCNEYLKYIKNKDERQVLWVMLEINYSKLYMNLFDYKKAKGHIGYAFTICVNNDIDDTLFLAASQNVLAYVSNTELGKVGYREFQYYKAAINIIWEKYGELLQSNYLTALYFALADIAIREKKYYEAGDIIYKGYYNDLKNDDQIWISYWYLMKHSTELHRCLEADTLKEILFSLAKKSLYRLRNISNVTDEKESLEIASQSATILRYAISYMNQGIICCSDAEYVELVVNLKNLYPDILKYNRNKTEETKMEWRWMTYDDIYALLPDKAIYIDYIQYPKKIKKENIMWDLQVSIIALYKDNRELHIVKVPSIRLMLERYLLIFMLLFIIGVNIKKDLSGYINFNKGYSKISQKLYEMLIGQILEICPQSVNTILISADAEINRLPFILLKDRKGHILFNLYNIIMLNSLRNHCGEVSFEEIDTKKALVVGNPSYTIDRTIVSNKKNKKYLVPLPLSKIETQIVSEILGVSAVTRNNANIHVFDNIDAQVLHIATHGDILNINEEEEHIVFPLSRCCMYMAGINDYIATGEESSSYGKGIITAEDMCKYNLSSVKVAVLSMCFSGIGHIDYSQGMLGFKTVLLGNGVRAIISCLWEVDDFACAIFMDRFYHNMKDMSLLHALRHSQEYLRTVTIGELKKCGWFEETRIRKVGLVADKMIQLANMPNNTVLFGEAIYWAGYQVMLQ